MAPGPNSLGPPASLPNVVAQMSKSLESTISEEAEEDGSPTNVGELSAQRIRAGESDAVAALEDTGERAMEVHRLQSIRGPTSDGVDAPAAQRQVPDRCPAPAIQFASNDYAFASSWQPFTVWYLVLCEAVVKKAPGQCFQRGRLSDEQPLYPLSGAGEIDYGMDLGGSITVDLENRRPSNDTYVMILSHGQWLLWRDTDMVTLASNPPQQEQGPLNSFLVGCWRGVLRDRLRGFFPIEAATSGCTWPEVLLVTSLQSPVDIHGQLSFENPTGQLPLQDTDVPKALVVATCVYFAPWQRQETSRCDAMMLAEAILFLSGKINVTAVLFAWSLLRSSALHSLLFLVLSLRAVVLLLRWVDFSLVVLNGQESNVADISWALFGKVQNILELMMFLLISLGWKVLRATLDVSEIRFAVAISIISFYLGIFQVAMNFNLQKLASAIADAPATVESGKLYRKLDAYHIFRWVFLLFIIAPTFELFLKVTIIPWDQQWLFVLLQELRTWVTWAAVIYVLLIYAYRPDPTPLRVFQLTEREASDQDE
ncbi:Protein GPR107 [Durusdinium trenchii]|uniref:Protein GPR107 n=1 Tax=Durusdinium trenchii TaxID=1381693 RepID=A0ABP0KRG6_9DINO